MSNSNADSYGRFYWRVGVPEAIAPTRQIYLHACRIEQREGALVFWSDHRRTLSGNEPRAIPFQVMALAAGNWLYCFAASVVDGRPIAVEHWKGELIEEETVKPMARYEQAPLEKNHAQRERARMDQGRRYRVMKRDGFKCHACGREPEKHGVVLEVDHVVPVSLGGKSDDTNLRTMCRDCNQSKGTQ